MTVDPVSKLSPQSTHPLMVEFTPWGEALTVPVPVTEKPAEATFRYMVDKVKLALAFRFPLIGISHRVPSEDIAMQDAFHAPNVVLGPGAAISHTNVPDW